MTLTISQKFLRVHVFYFHVLIALFWICNEFVIRKYYNNCLMKLISGRYPLNVHEIIFSCQVDILYMWWQFIVYVISFMILNLISYKDWIYADSVSTLFFPFWSLAIFAITSEINFDSNQDYFRSFYFSGFPRLSNEIYFLHDASSWEWYWW